MIKKYVAEFIGTFALAFVVTLAVIGQFSIATPILAAVTVGLFVYSIGHVSGTHINPAITIGLWSIKKISWRDAIAYIAAQLAGAFVALLIAKIFNPIAGTAFATVAPTMKEWLLIGGAELIGTFFFAFGVASAVFGKVDGKVSGVMVGGSLFIGIVIASLAGSLGLLNPAVALAIGTFKWSFIIGPIIGSVLGMQAYKYLAHHGR